MHFSFTVCSYLQQIFKNATQNYSAKGILRSKHFHTFFDLIRASNIAYRDKRIPTV